MVSSTACQNKLYLTFIPKKKTNIHLRLNRNGRLYKGQYLKQSLDRYLETHCGFELTCPDRRHACISNVGATLLRPSNLNNKS